MTVLPFTDGWVVEHLLDKGLITEQQVEEADCEGVQDFWTFAVEQDWLSDDGIAQAVASQWGCAVADLGALDPNAAVLIPEAMARQHHIVPIVADSRDIRIATSDPRDLDTEQTLAFITDRRVTFAVASPSTIENLLEELYRPEQRIDRLLQNFGPSEVETLEDVSADDVDDGELEAPISRLVDALVADGVRRGASDIHAEPVEGGLVVRFRIDGVLREVMRLPDAAGVALVRRVKVWARLDVTDPLHPHDGRASLRVDGKAVDLRVATSPVARRREKAVIRILDKSAVVTRLEDIGLSEREMATLVPLFDAREGILLMTGPTGSGKTTTLNAILQRLKTGRVNIVTVEDPVEYEIDGVSQIQVNAAQGLTFAAALRSVLRQDPDIVLVGEIRDTDTAQTAVQAGMTGHYVLSTLHTNDAPSAVVRLQDMDLDPFKIAAVLKGVLAQRLIRKVCSGCAEVVDPQTLPAFAQPPEHFDGLELRQGAGCQHCEETGFKGRIAVLEILPVHRNVSDAINEQLGPAQLAAAAREAGMNTLWESALNRVWRGLSTVDEVIRVLGAPTEADLPGALGPEAESAQERPEPTTERRKAPSRKATASATKRTKKAAKKATKKVTKKATKKSAKKTAKKATKKRTTRSAKKTAARTNGTSASTGAEAGLEVSALPNGGARILIADDDRLMRRLIRAVLEREGHEIAEAEDGLEALDLIENVTYDLMVLDCDMPRLDGLGVLEELRARSLTANTPVIMLTARGEETETQALDLGAQDFLNKPVQQKSLSARVRAVLRRAAL